MYDFAAHFIEKLLPHKRNCRLASRLKRSCTISSQFCEKFIECELFSSGDVFVGIMDCLPTYLTELAHLLMLFVNIGKLRFLFHLRPRVP